MSARSAPNVAATPVAPFSERSIDSPADTPDAARFAATRAAASMENAVPSTASLIVAS